MPDSSTDQIKILLIEDNLDHVEIIRTLLSEIKEISFDLEHAGLISEGLKILAKGDFDLVLLDPTLPDSRRIDTLKKTHNCAPEVPIIVISSLEDEFLAAQAVNLGVQDCLIKDQLTGSLLSRSIRYAIERRRAEEALRESEEKWRSITENSPDFILMLDRDFNIQFINKTLTKPKEEVIGTPIFDYVSEKSRPEMKSCFQQVLETGKPELIEKE